MADLIDANAAKQMLGCDDATLSNYINNGTVRAQRVNGQLMLNSEDVANVARGGKQSDSDDGTIILSGDSEDLSIDLGEVIDDSAVTMVQGQQGSGQNPTESITFGEDLEVVNFDAEDQTGKLSFDETGATQNLSFTDEQTVVLGASDVDETGYQTAAATDDFQTVQDAEDQGSKEVGAGIRRSIRSQRVRSAPVKTHWIFPTMLVLTMLVIAFGVLPYFVLYTMPRQDEEQKGENPAKPMFRTLAMWLGQRGTTDSAWTNMASSIVGFSVEPDYETYRTLNPTMPENEAKEKWKTIELKQGHQDKWRYKMYQGPKAPTEGAKVDDYLRQRLIVTRLVQAEPSEPGAPPPPPTAGEAVAEGGTEVLVTYPVQEQVDNVDADPENPIKQLTIQQPLPYP